MTTFKIVRKSSTGEYVVVVKVNGKRDEARCYYTNNLQDARNTMFHMQEEQDMSHITSIFLAVAYWTDHA